MLCSIRSQAISQNQDRVTRPHEHIAKRCLDFHLDGQEIVGTSNHLKQGCMLLFDDGDDDNGAITFASDADDDAFAIQDASEPSPSL